MAKRIVERVIVIIVERIVFVVVVVVVIVANGEIIVGARPEEAQK